MSNSGLTFRTFLNNDSFIYTQDGLPTSIDIFNNTPDSTGIVTTINTLTNSDWIVYDSAFNNEYLNYFAISLSGYFYTTVTGTYTFYFYNYNGRNDDISFFYIGDNAINPTTTNYSNVTTFDMDVSLASYRINLNANTYYPVLLYFGQSFGGYNLTLGVQAPGDECINYDSKYFYICNPLVYSFGNNTKILCFKDNVEEYIPIQYITKNTFIKTFQNGHLKVKNTNFTEIYNPNNDTRIKDRLYELSTNDYPRLRDNLFLTGTSFILVNSLTSSQKRAILASSHEILTIDSKYKLMTILDDKAIPYERLGYFKVWQLVLENNNGNTTEYVHGIYANGLLVLSNYQ